MSKFSHNISGDAIGLSFELLLHTAQIAVGGAKIACERELGAVQTQSFAGNWAGVAVHSKYLAQAAANLATATDTLAALEASKSRDKVTLST